MSIEPTRITIRGYGFLVKIGPIDQETHDELRRGGVSIEEVSALYDKLTDVAYGIDPERLALFVASEVRARSESDLIGRYAITTLPDAFLRSFVTQGQCSLACVEMFEGKLLSADILNFDHNKLTFDKARWVLGELEEVSVLTVKYEGENLRLHRDCNLKSARFVTTGRSSIPFEVLHAIAS